MQERRVKITCESNGLMPIDELDNFQGDLKTLDDESFKKLKGSIVKYGFSFPIFTWNGSILDGHQRLKAVKSLVEEGYTLDGDLLPVDHIEAKNEKEAAEKLLLINSRYAKIDQSGFDLFVENFDLDIADLSDMLDIPEVDFSFEDEEFEGNTDPDEVPEVEETPVTKMGDIWLLGSHRLMCGDSTKIEDVEKLMDGQKADMVFTDPPYELDAKQLSVCFENFTSEHIVLICTFKQAAELYKLNNFEFRFDFVINAHVPKSFMNHRQPYYTHQTAVYFSKHEIETLFDCNNCLKAGDEKAYWHTIIDAPRNTSDPHGHAKNINGLKQILKPFAPSKIVDMFVGSGSTIIAAQQTGRKCYAMEISPQYVQVAIKRWQDFTGEDAILESTGQTFTQVSEINCKRCI